MTNRRKLSIFIAGPLAMSAAVLADKTGWLTAIPDGLPKIAAYACVGIAAVLLVEAAHD